MPFCSISQPRSEVVPSGPTELFGRRVGFPTVAWFDEDGVALLFVGHTERTADGLRRSLARARTYVRLRAGAAAGDAAAMARFLRMQLEERQVELAEAERRRRELASDEAPVLADIDQHLVDLRIGAEVHAAGQAGRHRLGPRFLRILEEGPLPSPRVTRGFYYAILEWAERERDAAAFAKGLAAMRDALEQSDPGATWVPPLLARYEAKLRDIEKGR